MMKISATLTLLAKDVTDLCVRFGWLLGRLPEGATYDAVENAQLSMKLIAQRLEIEAEMLEKWDE